METATVVRVTTESSIATTAASDTAESATAASESGSGPPRRYRCSACGNLTRFTVVSTVRTRAFHHFSVGGDLTVEDQEVLDETIEEVSCRWCGNGNAVEAMALGEDEPEMD